MHLVSWQTNYHSQRSLVSLIDDTISTLAVHREKGKTCACRPACGERTISHPPAAGSIHLPALGQLSPGVQASRYKLRLRSTALPKKLTSAAGIRMTEHAVILPAVDALDHDRRIPGAHQNHDQAGCSTVPIGEGTTAELTGPGRLMLQSRSPRAFLDWLIPHIPKKE